LLDGFNSVAYSFYPNGLVEWDTLKTVLRMATVLKNNNFTFDGNHYLQINGTAMGTKMAPSYANMFMGNGLAWDPLE
jgi:hypothetical protein